MIDVSIRDEVAIVMLEHGKANTLDLELCRHVSAELDALTATARALVLTARGTIFSAGVDLLRVLNEGADYTREFLGALTAFCETVFAFPKPLVAAINGHAIAGGCVLACMADRRLMASGSGKIGVPELLVGVPFPAAPLEVLRFAVPSRHFPEIVYMGATYEPRAAVERGLVDEVVPAADLLDRAVAAARDLAALPTEAFSLTKRQVRGPAVERMRAAGALDAEVIEIWARPETKAAIRDYVSRTFKPQRR